MFKKSKPKSNPTPMFENLGSAKKKRVENELPSDVNTLPSDVNEHLREMFSQGAQLEQELEKNGMKMRVYPDYSHPNGFQQPVGPQGNVDLSKYRAPKQQITQDEYGRLWSWGEDAPHKKVQVSSSAMQMGGQTIPLSRHDERVPPPIFPPPHAPWQGKEPYAPHIMEMIHQNRNKKKIEVTKEYVDYFQREFGRLADIMGFGEIADEVMDSIQDIDRSNSENPYLQYSKHIMNKMGLHDSLDIQDDHSHDSMDLDMDVDID